MEEIWKSVVDFPGYEVSNLGRVKSLPREAKGAVKYGITETFLKQTTNNKGYKWVNIYDGKRKRSAYVHRLVAEAFIPNPEGKPNIDHINTNPLDNRVENLRWCTQGENLKNPITEKRRMDAIRRVCGTEEFRSRVSKVILGKMKNGSYRDKIRAALIEKYKDPKMRERLLDRNTQKKSVEHFDKDGNLIGTYVSTGDAARKSGLSQSAIWCFIHGKVRPKDKSVWRYKK